jgi:signal transduction histidine kinase
MLKKTNINYYFPWLSSLSALLLIAFLRLAADPTLQSYYHFDHAIFSANSLTLSIILFGLILLLDASLFQRRKRHNQRQIKALQKQLFTVWQSKKNQQEKAIISAGHTDKLKAFISDKLLETIEYDEKYLHFKGIAAEVRHNGVISYDKVMTALNQAIEQQGFLSLYEQNNLTDEPQDQVSQHTLKSLVEFQTAIDSMRYLWALLDLSTTDNIALHIGSHLIDCEEHYCQLQLDTRNSMDSIHQLPVSPTFSPQYAVLKTFSHITNEPEIKNRITLARINHSMLEEHFNFNNEQFSIELQTTEELLGNHNHIILLLENLIKNAQFFSGKNRFQQKTDRIVVRLTAVDGYANFSVYNRGPHIKEEDKPQIFKIGYSTRRNIQHHGKGIGLFFTNEIVKGYQGNIAITNVENSTSQYLLRINLSNNESVDYVIQTSFIDDKMKARIQGSDLWLSDITLNQTATIESLEVKALASDTNEDNKTINSTLDSTLDAALDTDLTAVLNTSDKIDASDLDSLEWLEPSAQLQPRWLIKLKTVKKEHKIIFKPLDIAGVQFDIKLPTAKFQLNE